MRAFRSFLDIFLKMCSPFLGAELEKKCEHNDDDGERAHTHKLTITFLSSFPL